MQTRDFDELGGRIEGVAQALLLLTADLEMRGLIDGPRLAQAWRSTRSPNALALLETARHTLAELAQALDDARSYRQSQPQP